MNEREQFEAWILDHEGFEGKDAEIAVRKRDNGRYFMLTIEYAWLAWQEQAARAAAPAEPQQPVAMYWGDLNGQPCINWLNGFDHKGQKVMLYASPIREDAWVAEAMIHADRYAAAAWHAGEEGRAIATDDAKAARAALERHLKGSNA
jgi:hypothetical protein